MSNHLAIATITATFQRVLQAAIQEDVYGARVTTVRPNTLESGSTETGVNIYLYLVTPNPAFRTPEPMTRRPKGELVKKSQVAVDLQYLVSFYGSETELEPQRLYGATLRTLQEGIVLQPEMIRETLEDPTLNFLTGADLADQVELVRIVPTEVSVENLSKLWSVFFQTPYMLSATFKGTVVLVDSEESGERALPVRDRRVLVAPFRQIVIDRIVAMGGAMQPILSDTMLVVTGRSLLGGTTLVRVAGIEVTPETVSDTRLTLPLTSIPRELLRAGVQGLQILHPVEPANPYSVYRGVESNLAAFVLRPTIVNLQVDSIEPDRNDLCSAEVTVEFDLMVGATQLVVLILNVLASDRTNSYLFKALARREDSTTVTLTLDSIPPGEYLVRAQIDGAESLLTHDTDPQSPTYERYISPRLTLALPDTP